MFRALMFALWVLLFVYYVSVIFHHLGNKILINESDESLFKSLIPFYYWIKIKK